jgi:uncharacterized protein YgfB (UPF0149 family)
MSASAFFELDDALRGTGSPVAAAEAHGCLCGALCVAQDFAAGEWASELVPDDADDNATAQLLDVVRGVHRDTRSALLEEDAAFQPLLPPEDSSLDERVQALADWCGGFLFGLGRGGSLDQLPGDLAEIMRDFSEIARASLAASEGGDAAERDFSELLEFVRASTQLAWAELVEWRARQARARQDH